MTKKAAALLLAASLAVSVCAMPVFADGPEVGSEEGSNTQTTAHTDMTYRVDCSYTWSIPKKIDFGANAGISETRTVEATADRNAVNAPATGNGKDNKGTVPKVCVTSNIIDVGKTLKISVDIDQSTYETSTDPYFPGNFYIECKGEKLPVTVEKLQQDGSKIALNSKSTEVLSVPSGTNTGDQKLVFAMDTVNGMNPAEQAGTYNGTLAFKSELVNTH